MAKRCESVALCVALLAVAAHGRAYGRAAVAAPISMALTIYSTSAVSTQSKAVVIASAVGYFAESLVADEDAPPPPGATCPDYSKWSNFTCKAVFKPESNMTCLLGCLENYQKRVRGLLSAKAEATALEAKGNHTRLVKAVDYCEVDICGDKEGNDRDACLVECFRDTANVDIAPGEPSLEPPSEPTSRREDVARIYKLGYDLPRAEFGFTLIFCGIACVFMGFGLQLIMLFGYVFMLLGLVVLLPLITGQ